MISDSFGKFVLYENDEESFTYLISSKHLSIKYEIISLLLNFSEEFNFNNKFFMDNNNSEPNSNDLMKKPS